MRWVMLRKQYAFTLVGCKQMVQDSGVDRLGFLAPGFTLGSHQAEVCETPSPILCKATPLQHMQCTSVPEPCPEGTGSGSRAGPYFSRCWPLLLQILQVGLPAAEAEGLHPGWHQHRPQKCPQHCPLRSSSCCTYFLQSRVTGYKVQRQCSVWCGTPDEAFQTNLLHWQAVQVNRNLKNVTENVLCRISAHSAQGVKISFLPLPCQVLCPQCNVSSACI